MPRVYISPSTQEHNIGAGTFGSEESQMNKISEFLVAFLYKDGHFTVKYNLPSMDVAQIATDSNNFKPDLHLAIHSNAGGGEGTEVYAYGPGTNSERFAKALYDQIAPLSPGRDRGVKFNKGLYEIGDRVNATSALIELEFHDNSAGSVWIVSNHQANAEALYKGVCDYYGYDYRALTPVVPPMPIVGAAAVTQPRKFAVDDGYLWVLCREPLMEQAKKDINKLGFACDRLNLAK